MLNIFLDFYIKFTSAILTFAVYGTERNKHKRVATHIEKNGVATCLVGNYSVDTLVAVSDGTAV